MVGYVITHELYKLIHKSLLEDISILELPDFGRGFLRLGFHSEITLSALELHFLITKITL